MKRYVKNKTMLSEEDMTRLRESRVCVAGCGGLGGYVIEQLSRIGVGHLTVIDGDVFDESNLNRQLLSGEQNLGKLKAEEAFLRVKTINSEVAVTALPVFLTVENVQTLIEGHHVVVDALDQIETRKLLAKACASLEIPLVYGAIAGWYGQVSTIFPGEDTLSKIYRNGQNRGAEKELGNPSFTPAVVASIQVSQVIKILIGRGELFRNRVLHIDLLDGEFEWIDF